MGREVGAAPPIVNAAGDSNKVGDFLSQDEDGVNSVADVHAPEMS